MSSGASWSSSRATARLRAKLGRVHERSRFVRQSGRWWYLDGVHT
ncbi:YchJ family metal-binding protein [Microbacterium gorillae]